MYFAISTLGNIILVSKCNSMLQALPLSNRRNYCKKITFLSCVTSTGRNVGIPFANPYFGVNNVLIQMVDQYRRMDNKARHLLEHMGHRGQLLPLPLDQQEPFHSLVHQQDRRIPMAYPKVHQLVEGHRQDHQEGHRTHMVYHKEPQLGVVQVQAHQPEPKIHMEYRRVHQLALGHHQERQDNKTLMGYHKVPR